MTMTYQQPAAVRTDAASVAAEHGRMFRRLSRQLGAHREALNDQGWRLLTHAAFALYLDSRRVPGDAG